MKIDSHAPGAKMGLQSSKSPANWEHHSWKRVVYTKALVQQRVVMHLLQNVRGSLADGITSWELWLIATAQNHERGLSNAAAKLREDTNSKLKIIFYGIHIVFIYDYIKRCNLSHHKLGTICMSIQFGLWFSYEVFLVGSLWKASL